MKAKKKQPQEFFDPHCDILRLLNESIHEKGACILDRHECGWGNLSLRSGQKAFHILPPHFRKIQIRQKSGIKRSNSFERFFLGVFNFLQKTNKNKSTWGFREVLRYDLFVCFLEETSNWKKSFWLFLTCSIKKFFSEIFKITLGGLKIFNFFTRMPQICNLTNEFGKTFSLKSSPSAH